MRENNNIKPEDYCEQFEFTLIYVAANFCGNSVFRPKEKINKSDMEVPRLSEKTLVSKNFILLMTET